MGRHSSSRGVRQWGRGSKVVNDKGISTDRLLDRHELVSSSRSKSTTANVNRARKLISSFAISHDAPDPIRVTPNYSELVMNLIAKYCCFGSGQALREDATGALIQGLRIVYSENRHWQNWSSNENSASGNPLNGNPDISSLRRAHRVTLTRMGNISLKARLVTAAIICDHAKRFWFTAGRNSDTSDLRDCQLHPILVLGIHLGLRFDEIANIKVEHISVTSEEVIITVAEAIKNSTVQQD